MERLNWYRKRLAVMERGEIRHRIAEQLRLRLLAAGQRQAGHATVAPPGDWRQYAFCTSAVAVLPALEWDQAGLAAALGGWRRGAWPALGFDWAWREDDPDVWRRAPDTGQIWPDDFFVRVPYRAGNPYGDARVVWEPARLQQLAALARLAQTAEGSEGEAIGAFVASQLRSWVDANPPYRGVHYISAMECALRTIAACHALDMLRTRLPAPDTAWPALLTLVFGHAALIARRLSLYSSRGNHTIAEGAGLLYAGTLFPEHPQAARWRTGGLKLLVGEADRQVLPDGGGIERALHYHRFVMDLLALAAALLEKAGDTVPETLTAALDRGRRFLAAVTLPNGETFPAGDGDGGYALSRFVRLHGTSEAETGAAVHFPDTGYTVLRAEGGQSPLALFDHGPLGMPPSYGHAHADALSFVLYPDGEPMLMDPGTFTYTGQPAWRRYFRSTAAHNTVRVNGADQAAQETAFQWSAARPCRLLRTDTTGDGVVRALAMFGGEDRARYAHLRGIAYAPDDWIFVWDFVAGESVTLAEQYWHCGADVQATASARIFMLTGGKRQVLLRLRGGDGAPAVVRGAERPPLGWASPVYGRKAPCTVIRRTARRRAPVSFETILTLSGEGPDNTVLGETVVRWQKWAQDAGAY